MFIDNQSIGPGQPFAEVLEDGVGRSAVLVALIGPRSTEAPFIDRLFMADDWVRRGDPPRPRPRSDRPPGAGRPRETPCKRSTSRLSCSSSPDSKPSRSDRQIPKTLTSLQTRLLHSFHLDATERPCAPEQAWRTPVERLLKRILPPAQQWSGNRDRLVDLVLALLGRDDRLVYLVPARLKGRPRGSATMILTEGDIVVADVDKRFQIIGEIRFPREYIRRVEVVPTLPLFADVIVHPTAGDPVQLLGLFRDQARRLPDHLRS